MLHKMKIADASLVPDVVSILNLLILSTFPNNISKIDMQMFSTASESITDFFLEISIKM